VKTRGRSKVLAHLAVNPLADLPTSWELRDGQIYRWTVQQAFAEQADAPHHSSG
jgi:hypothetical protein